MGSNPGSASDPFDLQRLSPGEAKHAYRVTRTASILWAALRLLSLPFLMLAAVGAAWESGHDVFTVPVLGSLVVIGIIASPFLVLGIVGADVLFSMTSPVVIVAGEVMRLARPRYEEDSIPEEVGRGANIVIDVADARVIGRRGDLQSLQEFVGCRSFHVFELVRRRLYEGDDVVLLGVERGQRLLVRFRPRRLMFPAEPTGG